MYSEVPLTPHLVPSNIQCERRITVLRKCAVVLGAGALVREGIVGNLQYLPTADKRVCAVAVLRRLGCPRLERPLNAVAKEMRLCTENLSRPSPSKSFCRITKGSIKFTDSPSTRQKGSTIHS